MSWLKSRVRAALATVSGAVVAGVVLGYVAATLVALAVETLSWGCWP